jgi:hypothetical protein
MSILWLLESCRTQLDVLTVCESAGCLVTREIYIEGIGSYE